MSSWNTKEPLWTVSEVKTTLEKSGVLNRDAENLASKNGNFNPLASNLMVSSVAFDSRILTPGSLFIPLSAAVAAQKTGRAPAPSKVFPAGNSDASNKASTITQNHTDGHAFIADAFRQGAACSLTAVRPQDLPKPLPQSLWQRLIPVTDTWQALEALALAAKERAKNTVRIAITGSLGKTTLKRLGLGVFQKLGCRTHASPANFNNQLGLLFSLANLPKNTDVSLFELGMDRPGEIGVLSRLVQPHMGLIGRVSTNHAENFMRLDQADLAPKKTESSLPDAQKHAKDLPVADELCANSTSDLTSDATDIMNDIGRRIALEKSDLFQGMKPGSTAIINRDSKFFCVLEAEAHKKKLVLVTFGAHPNSMYHLEKTSDLDGQNSFLDTPIQNAFPQKKTDQKNNHHKTSDWKVSPDNFSRLPGLIRHIWPDAPLHQKINALGVAALCQHMPEPHRHTEKDIFAALEKTCPTEPGRGQQLTFPWRGRTLTVIDETYNAHPLSMQAMLQHAAAQPCPPKSRRLAVLGDMKELGPFSASGHKNLARFLGPDHFHAVILVGPLMQRFLAKELPERTTLHLFRDTQELISFGTQFLNPGDHIYVKGSFAVNLGRWVSFLKNAVHSTNKG